VFVGAYTINNDMFDVAIVILFGIIGYIMKRYGFSPPAAVLGFILGGYVEINFRRGLAMSNGDFLIFLERPISLVLLILALISLAAPFVQDRLMARYENRKNPQQPSAAG